MVSVIPTILVKNFEEFRDKVRLLENDFEAAQIDVMDGKFVPNTTFFDITKIENFKTPLNYEIHLMVQNPVPYIEATRRSEKIKKILFHIESKEDPQFLIELIKKYNRRVGIVLNPQTLIQTIRDYITKIDTVMLMGVHPGFSGQEFIPQTIDRVKEIRALDRDITIEIDGGVSDSTAESLVSAGATILAVGSFIYRGEPKKQKEKILNAIKSQNSNTKKQIILK